MSTDTKHRIRTEMEVKALNEEDRTFKGLASTWDLDLGGDIIHRGAFRRTLDHWRSSGKPLPLIDQHNYGSIRSVVGKLIESEETDEGLMTEWQIIEGPDGDEVMRRVKGGYIDSLSIGYSAVRWDTEEDEDNGLIRHLREVKLSEVSLVIWPMNPEATIDADSLKSALASMSAEQKEEVRALLQDPEPETDPAPKGLAPETRSELSNALLRLKLRRLAARATAHPHTSATTHRND